MSHLIHELCYLPIFLFKIIEKHFFRTGSSGIAPDFASRMGGENDVLSMMVVFMAMIFITTMNVVGDGW